MFAFTRDVSCPGRPPPPSPPWCLANWLLLFYQSASGSPTWLIFYSPSSFEETSCLQPLGSWVRPSQPWLVPLCLLNISSPRLWYMPCRTFTLSCLCLLFLFLFPILIIRSLLPEGFMQQDIICNTTHDPITKPFSYFIACCSKTFVVTSVKLTKFYLEVHLLTRTLCVTTAWNTMLREN